MSITLPATTLLMACWEWEESPGKYTPYTVQATVDIELAYMNSFRTVDLSTSPAQIPYTVDIHLQQQTRHGFGTKRRIRRVPLTYSLQQYLKDRKINNPTHTSMVGSGTSAAFGHMPSSRGPSKGSHTSFTSGATGMMTRSHSSSGSASIKGPPSSGTTSSSFNSFTSPATKLIAKSSHSPPKKTPPPKVTKKGSTTAPPKSKGKTSSSISTKPTAGTHTHVHHCFDRQTSCLVYTSDNNYCGTSIIITGTQGRTYHILCPFI